MVLTAIPQKSNLSKLTLDDVKRGLPASLLTTLERRWYDEFRLNQVSIAAHKGGDLRAETRFLQIYEIAHNENLRQSLHLYNMQNVISSLRDGSHSLAYAVCSDGQQLNLLLGVRDYGAATQFQTKDYVDVLYRALRSNYPGIVLAEKTSATESEALSAPYRIVPYQDYQSRLIQPIKSNQYLASITGIPSLRDPNAPGEFFSQSIDRLVDALRGETYVLLILAEPIPDARLIDIMTQLRAMSQEVHNLVNQSITISRSKSQTKGETRSESNTLQLGGGQIMSTIFGISLGQTWTQGVSQSDTDSMGASVMQEELNKTAQFCEQVLDHFITRVQNGRSLGFWNVGVYLTSSDFNTFLRAQGIARSLYAGQNTYLEPLRVLDLSYSQPARDALSYLRNPALEYLTNPSLDKGAKWKHPLGEEYQSLGTPLATDELSLLVSFPTREVPGLKLKPTVDFNLNPPRVHGAEIGSLLYRGEELPARIAISRKSLTRHTFITGLTGSGKTNTCLALLANAYHDQKLNFLVIDPAKTEYRFLMNALGSDLMVFTLGDETLSPFRLNPFEFVRGFPLLAHIDLLKEVFNAAFPMYASMPYLLEEALLDIYTERGWDISSSTNRFLGDIQNMAVDYVPYLPKLSDLYAKIDVVVERKGYGAQISQDLSAALKARLSSLLHGGKGLMLDTQRSIPIATLLDRPVVLELRRAGNDDERAFLLALLFILLYEACQTRPPDNDLKHVTLIEEAHRLLKNIPTVASMENANPRGKTVEMFTDMMAEMRAHGEGFIIVDQMPGKLVPDVIKGSNLKIVHRLMAQDDRAAVGNAMGLTYAQIEHLPRLTVGQGVVHSEELREACLVKIDAVEDKMARQFTGNTPEERHETARRLLREKSYLFYQANAGVLQRYPGCILCDSPCAYHPDENMPALHAQTLANSFLAAAALASAEQITRVGQNLARELTANLNLRFPHGYSAGKARCMRVILAGQSARRFCEAYPQVENWQVVLEMQVLLAQIWESWPTNRHQIMSLRELILRQVAKAPATLRPGCTSCLRRCWFGFLFQTKENTAVARLKAQLKTTSPGLNVSVDKLTQFVQNTYQAQLAPGVVSYAAYCLLTQATDDEARCASFRRDLTKK